MVASIDWCSFAISTRIWTRSAASRFESGSSNRKTRGLADDGAADGDALALAARELLGLALEQVLDLEDAGGLPAPGPRSAAASVFASFRPKAMFS